MSLSETNYVLRDFWRKPGKVEVAAIGGNLDALKKNLVRLGVPESAMRKTVVEPDEGIIISGEENLKIIANNGGRFTGSSDFIDKAKGA